MHKHMLRALGLSLLATLGLMAFTAAGAQAEALKGVAGRILIGGVDATTGTIIEGSQENAGTLLIPALNTEIVCQKIKVVTGKVIGKGEGLGEILYEECAYWGTKTKIEGGKEILELTTKLACEILEDSETKAPEAIVAKAKLLVVLHEVSAGVSDTYILAEADNATGAEGTLASVLVKTPGECPLPKLVEVTGSVVFKVTLGDLNLGQAEELYVLVTASKELSKAGLFTDKLKFGINPAFIDGSALLWLASKANWGLI